MHAALEKTGCPVPTPARGAVSGAKVAGPQRCSKSPHGFFAPRLDWSQAFTLPASQAKSVDVRVLVDRSIVEVFVGGGRVAAVMDYQPPNDVSGRDDLDLLGYSGVHLFAEQAQEVTGLKVWQMGCGWNQTTLALKSDDTPADPSTSTSTESGPRGAPPPYWPTHGWRNASAESLGMSSSLLAAASDWVGGLAQPDAFVVVRRGE